MHILQFDWQIFGKSKQEYNIINSNHILIRTRSFTIKIGKCVLITIANNVANYVKRQSVNQLELLNNSV